MRRALGRLPRPRGPRTCPNQLTRVTHFPERMPPRVYGRRLCAMAGALEARHVAEPGVHPAERDLDGVLAPVAVLGYDQVGPPGGGSLALVGFFGVKEPHDVGVLLVQPR